MRRKDREMGRDFAVMVVDKCEWATISMVDGAGMPYAVPITIVRCGEGIYFHAAKAGYKTECLRACPNICLTCVGDTRQLPNEFTTEYESAIVQGLAREVTDTDEKSHVLRVFCERHTPTNMHNFDVEMTKRFGVTAVWKIDIISISGKRIKYGKDGTELRFGKAE